MSTREANTVTTQSSIAKSKKKEPRAPVGVSNKFRVNRNDDGTQITHPPTINQSLTRGDAMVLAGWLLEVNDVTDDELKELRRVIGAENAAAHE